MVSKVFGVRLAPGARVRLETPGGGGWGEARARDPARVARDVRLGYVTAEAARRDYAVVVAPDGTLDAEATEALRRGRAA